MKTTDLKKFLEELTLLSHRYDLYIGGCGCCGSPWVIDGLVPYSNALSCLRYDKDKGSYGCT